MEKKPKAKRVTIEGGNRPKNSLDAKLSGAIDDHLKKLDEQIAKVGNQPGHERFERIRKKLDAALKDRKDTRSQIDEAKFEYETLKDKVKGFLKDQIVNSHKSTIQTRKPKL